MKNKLFFWGVLLVALGGFFLSRISNINVIKIWLISWLCLLIIISLLIARNKINKMKEKRKFNKGMLELGEELRDRFGKKNNKE